MTEQPLTEKQRAWVKMVLGILHNSHMREQDRIDALFLYRIIERDRATPLELVRVDAIIPF